MKILFVLPAFIAFAAQAATPQLYCVSTKTYQDSNSWPINQINLYTNAKGGVMMSLQYTAWGQSEEEYGSFDTNYLLRLRELHYNSVTQTLSNANGKFVLKLGKTISAKSAEALLSKKKTGFDFENPSGFKVDFSKFQLARITAFDYPGQKGKWTESLANAYKAGVTDYVCGDAKFIKKSVKNKIDQIDND